MSGETKTYKNPASKVYLRTFGCQMNVYDSELMSGILLKDGFLKTDNADDADIILVNTCSVREHASQRAYGHLRSYAKLKEAKKDLILGVCGCLAESDNEKFLKVIPEIDLIIGPHQIRQIDKYIRKVMQNKRNVIAVGESALEWTLDLSICRKSKKKALVTISKGCNSFCSYCIVPYVRGREESRPFNDILSEVENLVKAGYKEITLIGQNVNTYGKDLNNEEDFPDLLAGLNQINGNFWIRFLTSHPKDIPSKLLNTVAESEKACKHFHLPIQSGSDKILKLMNRSYTVFDYKKIIDEIRKKVKNVSITTDVIVGFPGETKEDFSDTLELFKEVNFDSAFTFKYSPREGTSAYKLKDDVCREEKEDRLKILMDTQKQIALKKNKELIGSVQEIMLDDEDKSREYKIKGRTGTNKLVVIENEKEPNVNIDFATVKITDADAFALKGML